MTVIANPSDEPAMSQVFDYGSWLLGVLSGGGCLCHAKMSQIRRPSDTRVMALPLGNNTPTPDANTLKDPQWWSTITTVHQ